MNTRGECVSCCRRPPWPHYRVCPYCGEYVWMPAWWRMARVAVPVVCVLAVAGIFPLTAPHWGEAQDMAQWLPPLKSFLLAAAVVVLFMPCRDDDLIVSSRKEIAVWQLKTFAVCLFAGASLFSVNFCIAFARTSGGLPYLLYVITTASACALPFLHRVPLWRMIAAALLFAAVFVPMHVRNFF